jgi:hypothetical protein
MLLCYDKKLAVERKACCGIKTTKYNPEDAGCLPTCIRWITAHKINPKFSPH